MPAHRTQETIAALGILTALTALTVGAAAVLASGFTAGEYARTLTALVFSLGVLGHIFRRGYRDPTERERPVRTEPAEPQGTTFHRAG
jgi:hypothetical protein